MIGDGLISGAVSPFGAIINLSIENAKIVEGITWSIADRFVVQPATTKVFDILFDPTAFSKSELILLPISFKAFGAGPVFIDTYVDPVVTANGTEILSINRNLKIADAAELKIYKQPTTSSPGSKLPPEFSIFSDGTAAVAHVGGSVSIDLVLVIDPTKKYLFRLSNQENTNADATISSAWFEVI